MSGDGSADGSTPSSSRLVKSEGDVGVTVDDLGAVRGGGGVDAVAEEHLGELGKFRLGLPDVAAAPFDVGSGGDELVLVRDRDALPFAIDTAPAISPARRVRSARPVRGCCRRYRQSVIRS